MKNLNKFMDKKQVTLKYPIEYYVKDIKVGTDIIKKYFIIDTRNLQKEKIQYVFENFREIQEKILSDYFYEHYKLEKNNSLSTYPFNLELIYLVDEKQKYDIYKYGFLYNMEYALKSIMNESELLNLLNKEYSFKNLDKEILLTLKDRVIKLNHFNYIQGDNGSGKTMMLKEISKILDVRMFSLEDRSLNLENKIEDVESLNSIIYSLTGSYELDEYSDYSKYISRLSQILEFSKENNNVVLLDDLRWLSLDSRNRVKLKNALADYSYEYCPIVITGYKQAEEIKRKVYKPNIILANNK